MNYYKRHIGDYAAATRHLSMLEHGAYTMLLDTYYTTEQALPADIKAAARKAGARSKEEIAAVEVVLTEFFLLQPDGWHSARCDAEISAYQQKAETNRVVGGRGGRPKKPPKNNPDGFDLETQTVSENDVLRNHPGTLTTNHQPLTTNQEPLNPPHPPPNTEGGFSDFPEPAEPVGTQAGAVCKAMRRAGIADVNPANQSLLALLQAGATEAEFASAAATAAGSAKGFGYALGIVAGERKRAAKLARQVLHGTLPAAETTYQRSMRERMQEAAPEAARNDPLHPAKAAEFFNAIEVQPRTVERLP